MAFNSVREYVMSTYALFASFQSGMPVLSANLMGIEMLLRVLAKNCPMAVNAGVNCVPLAWVRSVAVGACGFVGMFSIFNSTTFYYSGLYKIPLW